MLLSKMYIIFSVVSCQITMAAEDRRDNEALYNKMDIADLARNYTEPAPTDNIHVHGTHAHR